MQAIKAITYWFVWILWAILGLLFWIPLLARSIATFAGAILYATLTESDTTHIEKAFERAVGFYLRGFKTLERIHSPEKFGTRDEYSKEPPSSKWWHFITEVLWTMVFWLSLTFFVAKLFGMSFSPLSLLPDPSQSSLAVYERAKNAFSQPQKNCAQVISSATDLIKEAEGTGANRTISDAYFWRAWCFHDDKKYDRAEADYRKAIELNPATVGSYHNLGLVLDALDRKAEALPFYRKYLEFDSSQTTQTGRDHSQKRLSESGR